MEIFVANFWWMIPNLALASLGFVFALLYLKSKSIFLRIPLFILWLLFLPNTIYLLTDSEHLVEQLPKMDFSIGVLILIQYVFLISLGVLTYFAAMMPIEVFLKRRKPKSLNSSFVLILLNFALGFGVVMGKAERTHSWYVFTQPLRVISDIFTVLTTPLLIIVVILLGILFNLIYFAFKNRFSKLK